MPADEPVELARCDEHGLVLLAEEEGAHLTRCVACEFDLDVRLDDDLPSNKSGSRQLTEGEFRRRLTWDGVVDLIPCMREYLADQDAGGDLWVTHVAWEGDLPAGYTEQERFVLAIGYEYGAREKYLTKRGNALQTVETLRSEGYGTDGDGDGA